MWKYCEICCVIITIYIKEKKCTKGRWKKKKKKPVTALATIQNLKKKKKKDKLTHQNCTVDEQWKTLYKQWQNTVAA